MGRKGGKAPKAKGRSDPRVKQLVDYAYQTYFQKYSVKMLVSAADCKQAKRALDTHDLETLKRYWDFFLNYRGNDWRLKNATRDIKSFCSAINHIVQVCPKDSGAFRSGRVERLAEGPPQKDTSRYCVEPEGFTWLEKAKLCLADLPKEKLEERLCQMEAEIKESYPIASGWTPQVLRETAYANLLERCANYLREKGDAGM